MNGLLFNAHVLTSGIKKPANQKTQQAKPGFSSGEGDTVSIRPIPWS